jgi:hypothetical protein
VGLRGRVVVSALLSAYFFKYLLSTDWKTSFIKRVHGIKPFVRPLLRIKQNLLMKHPTPKSPQSVLEGSVNRYNASGTKCIHA